MITKSTQATSRQFVATLLVVLLSWPVHAHADEVRVYAAASLTDAIGELAQDYSKTRGTEIKPVFAASSTLAKQIDAGAPASIFISADRKWMQYLTDRQRIAASASPDLLGNALVLIAPKGQAFKVRFEPDFKPASAFAEIGRAHVLTPVTNAQPECRPLREKKQKTEV